MLLGAASAPAGMQACNSFCCHMLALVPIPLLPARSQAALLRTNKAWAAVGQRCSPLEVAVAQAGGACWPLGKRWGNALPGSSAQPEKLGGGLPDVAAWLTRQRRLVVKMSLEFDSTRLLHWARADNAVNMGTEIVQVSRLSALTAGWGAERQQVGACPSPPN